MLESVETNAPSAGTLGERERLAAGGLVLGSVVSVQVGAAVATTLFDELKPEGAVLLRTLFGAAALLVLWRPTARRISRDAWKLLITFGFSLAAMNLSFYAALDRIPLGIAVTVEFIGPLGVAIAKSRRGKDIAWVALAGAGIALLSPGIGGSLDALGVGLAALAGVFWGAYILLAARVGRTFEGGGGLALAMSVSTLLLLPSGIAAGGGRLIDPGLLAVGVAVAILSSAIPYSLELEALRRIPERTFGVLMSLEPGVAALSGLAFLGQGISLREGTAIALVICASVGALGNAEAPAPIEV
jgi:inner membrane transporter RhtA